MFSEVRDYAQFDDTPLISTYLFAFALGDFAEVKTTSKSGVEVSPHYWNKSQSTQMFKVKTTAIAHLSAGLKRSADVAAGCINEMEKFTGVKYPLSKLDNVDMLTMGYAEVSCL
jgi:aminopeptidase N